MELKIATRHCADELGRSREFHYFLTVDLEESSRFYMENYGVCVQEKGGETCTLPALTTSASRIDELLTLLIENRVGPVGLADVVADWL